jgi:L-iditol 2-dehydrogenase
MKALVKTKAEYGALEMREVDIPSISENEILIQVKACGVCGSDLHAYEYSPGYEFLQIPLVLGHEFCGLVVEVGSQVKGIFRDDRVAVEAGFGCGTCLECRRGNYDFCPDLKAYGLHFPGGMAEYVKVKGEVVHRLDERITFLEGGAVEPTAIGIKAVFERSTVHPGDFVAVFGVGIIGLSVAQACRLKGADPILLIGREEDRKTRLRLAEQMEFHAITGSGDLIAWIDETFRGRRPSTIFECSGSTEALKKAIELACKGGRIVLVGIYGRPMEIHFTPIVRNQISIIPSYAYHWDIFERTIDLVAARKISLQPLLTPYPLEKGDQAFKDSLSKEIIKAVLQP